MDFLRESDELDNVAYGVSAAYRQLRDGHTEGIYTSLGRYYNHTIFGRDGGMSAKFVADFDHQAVWNTILTLASHQGTRTNEVTQEQPGRIHHELRDYTMWKGRWYDRIGLWWADRFWGTKNQRLLTYYAADTTATYIRLVHKYATHIDPSIVDRTVARKNEAHVSLRESVELAANWITEQVDSSGLFMANRTNRWSLPYQTFADSVTAYAWNDMRAADTSRPHGYVEVQSYGIDALEDAARLLPESPHATGWKQTAERMHAALMSAYWNEERRSFAPGIFARDDTVNKLDTDMITSGWTLNASFWENHMDMKSRDILSAQVRRLFEDDFLTDVGLRTKSTTVREPLGDAIDYHGSRTVWPMFNFMIIEGLRRHGLYQLARQLEYRILNGINGIGHFPEFFIVDHDKTLFTPSRTAKKTRGAQMIPEENIAFTVVPALTLSYRHLYKRHTPAESGWRFDLEASILAQIPNIDLLSPSEAPGKLSPTPLKLKRTRTGMASARHIAPVILKKV